MSLSNWAYPGSPTSRQCSVNDSTVRTAVTGAVVGQETTRPPCKDTPLSTSTSGPSLMTRPSTMSKLSSSARAAATSGRYHPRGGAGRRVLTRPSRAPRRARIRLIVRSDGAAVSPRSSRACWMAWAPTAPRSPWASSLRTVRIRSSVEESIRWVLCGTEDRSDQSTRSSRCPRARSTHRVTVATPTPKRRATARRDWPRRTAATMARRRSA